MQKEILEARKKIVILVEKIDEAILKIAASEEVYLGEALERELSGKKRESQSSLKRNLLYCENAIQKLREKVISSESEEMLKNISEIIKKAEEKISRLF